MAGQFFSNIYVSPIIKDFNFFNNLVDFASRNKF